MIVSEGAVLERLVEKLGISGKVRKIEVHVWGLVVYGEVSHDYDKALQLMENIVLIPDPAAARKAWYYRRKIVKELQQTKIPQYIGD